MSEADLSRQVGEGEFAWASGRGLGRVRNFVQDAKGMCKKRKKPYPSTSTELTTHTKPRRTLFLGKCSMNTDS